MMSKSGMMAPQDVEEGNSVSRRKLPTYNENPFWKAQELKIGKKLIRVAGGMHVDTDTGESIRHSGIHIIEEKDSEEFVKLYTRNMRLFFDLKPSTQKVLQAILDTVQKTPNSDCIYLHWFNVEKYSEQQDLKVSRASFHNAMRELLDKGFIAEAVEPHKFWINSNLFFNGDRMVIVNEYRRRLKEIKGD